MKPADADHRPPPTIVLAAGWRADWPTPILRPDHRADPGKQTMPRSGNHQYNDPSAQICDHSMAGSQKQAIPEGFRNLSCFARSGFRGQNEPDRCRSPPPDHRSRCWLEGRLPHPDTTSRSPRRSGQANDAPIRGQLIQQLISPNLRPLYGWASEHPVQVPSNLAMFWSLFSKYCNGLKGSKWTVRTFVNLSSFLHMHVCFKTWYNRSGKVVTHPLIRGWNLVNIGTLQYFNQST